MTFLDVEGLTTRYQTTKGEVHALSDVHFSLEEGESIGIAGESACGKSTLGLSLIRMIQGGKIAEGKVSFNGELILDLAESKFDDEYRWKKISMVFQGAMNSLDPVYTIKQQFVEVLKEHNYQGDSEKLILDSLTTVRSDEPDPN